MVFKIISMFVHPSRKVSTDLSYTLEEDVFEKYLIHGFVFTDLGILPIIISIKFIKFLEKIFLSRC